MNAREANETKRRIAMLHSFVVFLGAILLASIAVAGDSTPNDAKKADDRKKPKVITFSGYEWTVKSGKPPLGPGPNYFSDSENNVWLDDKGYLHLKITQKDGVWHCAEVDGVKPLGYGKYIFHLAGKIDKLDRNTVLGLFTYDCRSPDAEKVAYREIDIEFGTYGKTDNPRVYGLLSVCPGYVKGNRVNFDIQMNQELSTHSFDWQSKSISFRSVEGDGADAKEIFAWNYTGKAINKPGQEVPMINLWLWSGKPPVEGKELEIVVRKFEFIPAQK
jgi:hypothetical protein